MALLKFALRVLKATILFEIAAFCRAVTLPNKYLAGNSALKTLSTDWLGCLLSCKRNPNCVSYNFKYAFNICELNEKGMPNSGNTISQIIVDSSMVFHQIKPLSGRRISCFNHHEAINRCNCNHKGKNSCSQQPNPDPVYRSCRDIYTLEGVRENMAFNITPKASSRFLVYCQMTELESCPGGGWTLAMKINGSKTTFRYNSPYWTDQKEYQPEAGVDLEPIETKLPSYWLTPLTKLCVGMKVDDKTHWIFLKYNATSLYHVISDNQHRATNITLSTWKSLVPQSSLQVNCTKQGFNTRHHASSTSARARLGIIGFSYNCISTSESRIGFGTAGEMYGMNDANSCGNEARSNSDNGDKSVKAFGYIFVQ